MRKANKHAAIALIAAMLLAAVATGRAQSAFGLQLNGVLTTEVATTTGTGFKSTPVNNNTIIAAVIASSTVPGLTKKDFALVMGNPNGKFGVVGVIKISGTNLTEVALIGTPESSGTETGIGEISKNGKTTTFRGMFLPYDFTLPGVSGTDIGGTLFSAAIESGTNLKRASFSFVTGNGNDMGATLFQGTMHLNGKNF